MQLIPIAPWQPTELFVSAPKGLTRALAEELKACQSGEPRPTPAGVKLKGSLEDAYRICIWSRIGNRVLMPLAEGEARDADQLYDLIKAIPWEEHMDAEASLAVDTVLARSPINHSQFAAQRTKDAVCDRFRDQCGLRPSVDLDDPDLRINVLLRGNKAIVSIDLSGGSLHRRGYRQPRAAAPLKENLAAGVLRLAGWKAEQNLSLIDPMCGSGTLLIEAGLVSANIAPGLVRRRMGSPGWKHHQIEQWTGLLDQAEEQQRPLQECAPIVGWDIDPKVVDIARENVRRAGLASLITVRQRALTPAFDYEAELEPGILVTNPPYGERLGNDADLRDLYAKLGELIGRLNPEWRAAVLTANREMPSFFGLQPSAHHDLFNGALETRLFVFAGDANAQAASEDLSNRLRKNQRGLKSWLKREQISCYRLYDADLPEFNVAVDVYRSARDGELNVHLQEYAPPKSVDPDKARARLAQAVASVAEVLELPAKRIFMKVRKQQKGSEQYRRVADEARFDVVNEGLAHFRVNYSDYLDTGLFLDHRPIRLQIARTAKGKDFLNLFSYTATASVHAALGGATSTTSVDLSPTYTDWAAANLDLNDLPEESNHLVQADVFEWLRKASRQDRRWDLIFCDPPSFSNSKRTETVLDIQRDHVELIELATGLLAQGGTLLFSTNLRQFQLDPVISERFQLKDISKQSIPADYKRNQRIHQCWEITLKPAAKA